MEIKKYNIGAGLVLVRDLRRLSTEMAVVRISALFEWYFGFLLLIWITLKTGLVIGYLYINTHLKVRTHNLRHAEAVEAADKNLHILYELHQDIIPNY